MFDIGWSEIVVVAAVSSVVLDFKDIPKIIKQLKKISLYLNNIVQDIKEVFSEIEQESNKIIDLEGKEQITYDLSDFMPDIKKTTKRKSIHKEKIKEKINE